MKKIFSLLLFSFVSFFAFGQTITFQEAISDNTQGPGGYAAINDVKETYDNGYIVAGFIAQGNAPLWSSFLMKLDKDGDTLWIKYFNGIAAGGSILLSCDGGYITSGKGLTKTDSEGNTLWSKYYTGTLSGSDAIKTNDCGYILASTTDSFGAGGNDIYLVKTNSIGTPLWSKAYGRAGDDEPTDIQQTTDGGYIIAGYTNSFDTSGNYQALLIKTDANGDTLWTKTYGQAYYYADINYSVQETYDHGYILSGLDMIKIDSMGNVMWSKNYDNNEGISVQQTLDSGYIFLSEYTSLIKTDITGNVLWGRAFYSPPRDPPWGTLVFQTNDGGYIVANQIQYVDDPADEFWSANLMKTDAKGQSGCFESNITVTASPASTTSSSVAIMVTSPVVTAIDTSVSLGGATMWIDIDCFSDGISESHSENSLTIYPNPATTQLTLQIPSLRQNEPATISITNVLGQETSPPAPLLEERGVATIDVSGLAAGIYFVQVVGEKGRWVGKFVKE